MNDTIDSLKEAEKEAMQNDSKPRHVRGYCSNGSGGLILIGIGTFFLLSQFTNLHLHNWWALFILFPAFANFSDAWQGYQANGRLTNNGRRSLIGGLFISMVALFFLFSLSWNLFWPLALIIVGINALLNGRS